MIALIDGDLVCYRNAASAENETVDVALWRCDDLIHNIMRRTGATEHKIYLSGGDNFRKQIDPNYKANRSDMARPKYLELCREHLVRKWNASVTDGIEADDAIGIRGNGLFFDDVPFVHCSLDKDFLQLPGKHYQWEFGGRTAAGKSWLKEEQHLFVTPLDGLRAFYRQLLIGDTADNVIGVEGIGPVRAARAINNLTDEEEMYQTVRELYSNDERFEKNCQLLWILRMEGVGYLSPSKRKQDAENRQ
jgi:5'-3' exonuclease